MTLWFTSDTHFNHANIIGYCKRPFANVDEMNRELIARWNAKVKPDDVVMHMGDFAMGKKEDLPAIFAQLNGLKHLIRGNHDGSATVKLPWIDVLGENMVMTEAGTFYCIHDPANAKGWMKTGTTVIHGHLHGMENYHPFAREGKFKYVDAGVDCWNYEPVTLEQLIGAAK